MIALVGFMGAGKTTVGRLLARRLGVGFVDTDEVIEARTGATVEDIFAAGGEAAFRDIERDVVAEVLAGNDGVVALGGGAVTDPATCTALEWATVVYLQVGYSEAMRRVGEDPGRPMLAAADPKALYVERAETYRRIADVVVDTSRRTPETVAEELAARVGPRRAAPGAPGVRTIHVPLGERSYDVVVGAGIAAGLHSFLPEMPDAAKAIVVTHPALEAIAGPVADGLASAGLRAGVVTVAEGEASKSLAVAGSLYERLAEAEMHRRDLVVAVGGGVVCDLAGFVASTYNRGMPVAHVATSLLAQVDAAIGGKTGIDLPHGKNLVGTFHQPVAVVCDVVHLDTLPEAEVRSGMAEVVKYGLIAEPDLLDAVVRAAPRLPHLDRAAATDIVARSAAIKARVVGADEREGGERAVLNYGHTFGHAIEQVTGYRIRHGEAIALGMMAAAYLAQELGRVDEDLVLEHRRVLTAVGLPVAAALDASALEAAWRRDKKHRGGTRFVLLAGLGKAEAGVAAPADAVRRAIARLAAGGS